jgi:hypothetical protein
MSSVDKSGSKSLLSVQMIVLIELLWAMAAFLFFALFGVTPPGEPRSFLYSLGTSIFEATAYLVAASLCFRNWGSSQIVSGRSVWLNIGLGMLFYFLGNLLFSYWELGLKLEPDVSPGDFFFVLTYIFLLIGMVQAVFSRRLNLELWQKGIVVGIGVLGIVIALSLAGKPGDAPASRWLITPPAYAQAAPQTVPTTKPLQQAQSAPASAPKVAPPPPAAASSSPDPSKAENPDSPGWATALEKQLQPLSAPVQFFYLICDVLLLVLATTLLLAFWGGRFSQSWRMIAIAAFFLYLGDIAFKYATRDPNYQSGGLLEVSWVFSAVLFGIGAALEYDLSSRSRRSGSRRRG